MNQKNEQAQGSELSAGLGPTIEQDAYDRMAAHANDGWHRVALLEARVAELATALRACPCPNANHHYKLDIICPRCKALNHI